MTNSSIYDKIQVNDYFTFYISMLLKKEYMKPNYYHPFRKLLLSPFLLIGGIIALIVFVFAAVFAYGFKEEIDEMTRWNSGH